MKTVNFQKLWKYSVFQYKNTTYIKIGNNIYFNAVSNLKHKQDKMLFVGQVVVQKGKIRDYLKVLF